MPPWLPADGDFEFKQAPTFAAEDLNTLKAWRSRGEPRGDIRKLPPPPSFPTEWQLGEPDLVVEMQRPYSLAADGPDVYRNFVIPLAIDRKKYVKAFELRPNNPKVVHHAFVMHDLTGESRRLDEQDTAEGYDGMDRIGGAKSPDGHLIAWLPGRHAIISPEAMPWSLHPGSDLVLQVHMQPSGREELVSAKVGFYFTDRPPSKFPVKLSLFSAIIDIPAGEENYIVTDSFTLPVDVSTLAITAHAHYLGRRLQALAKLPDGTVHSLLNIPEWDFNWQGVYEYESPPVLPRGTELEMRFQYDNSSGNPLNPNNPPKRVQYGAETTDEMAEVWLQVLPRSPQDRDELLQIFRQKVSQRILAHCEHVLSQQPDDVEAMIRRSKALLLLDREVEALNRMQDAVIHFPNESLLHMVLGEIYLLHFDSPSTAVSCFQRALKLEPSLPGPHAHLGRIFFKLRQFSAAESHFAAVPATSPDYAVALCHLGVISVEQGQLKTALDYFERCVQMDPTNDEYVQNVENARTLLRAGQQEQHPQPR